MASLGLDALVTVMVPGSIFFLAVMIAIGTFCPELGLVERLGALSEWQATLLVLVAVTFFGILLQSLVGLLEEKALDPISKRLVKSKDFYGEWDRYIDSLEEHVNPYVTRIAHTFYFELRAGIAAILLGASVLVCTAPWKILGAPTIAVGVILVLAAAYTHYWLALFRKRRYEVPVSKRPNK